MERTPNKRRRILPKRRVKAPKKPLKYLRKDLEKILEKLKENKDEQSQDILSRCNTWLSVKSKSHQKEMRKLGSNHPDVANQIEELKQEGAEILLEYNLGPGFDDRI